MAENFISDAQINKENLVPEEIKAGILVANKFYQGLRKIKDSTSCGKQRS